MYCQRSMLSRLPRFLISLKLLKNCQATWPRFSKIRKTWSFQVVGLQRTARKCSKIYNARAQLLFCSLNLLFGDIPVGVVVVVCLSFVVCSSFSFYFILFNAWCLLPCLNKDDDDDDDDGTKRKERSDPPLPPPPRPLCISSVQEQLNNTFILMSR